MIFHGISTIMLLWSTTFLTLVGLASAAAIPRDGAGFYDLTQRQIDSTDVFANYAAAVKCGLAVANWNCGLHCQAIRNFEVYANGGDGDKIQFWFVGFDRTMQSVILVHEGTEKTKFSADVTDLEIVKTKLDPYMFPRIPNGIEVHGGFAEEHAKTAAPILQAVESLLQMNRGATVTVIGHSLGGALALLDGVRLRLILPSTTDVRVVTYGMPRVGNHDFANFADAILPNRVRRINNRHDPIPIVPAMSLGFHHVSGEIHIQDTGEWTVCPGADNPDPRCIVGAVPTVFQSTFSEHSGPYNRVNLKCYS